MNLLSFFGTSTNSAATIPTFDQGENHDSVDLQIKSLLYNFKRLRLNKLSSFLKKDGNAYNLKYIDGDRQIDSNSEVQNYFQKLDTMYNVEIFKQVMVNDEYRVMVDFIKNKFRSYCILSEYPSECVVSSSKISNGEFCEFKDYKDRDVKHFRFSIIPLRNTSIAFIANTLSMSDIYVEHHNTVEFNTRYQYAMDSITKVLNLEKNRPDINSPISITDDEKALMIEYYLKRMAFVIQLNRIYEEYLRHQATKYSPTKLSTPLSPYKSIPSLSPSISSSNFKLTNSMSNLSLTPSPPKLSPKKSMADLGRCRSPSPIRTLKSKPSIAKMKLGEVFNGTLTPGQTPAPQIAHNASISDTSSTTTLSNDNVVSSPKKLPEVTTEIKLEIWEKCKQAIKEKLEQERKTLSVQ